MEKKVYFLDEVVPNGVYWLVEIYEAGIDSPLERLLATEKSVAIDLYKLQSKLEEYTCSERVCKAPRKVFVEINNIKELH